MQLSFSLYEIILFWPRETIGKDETFIFDVFPNGVLDPNILFSKWHGVGILKLCHKMCDTTQQIII